MVYIQFVAIKWGSPLVFIKRLLGLNIEFQVIKLYLNLVLYLNEKNEKIWE